MEINSKLKAYCETSIIPQYQKFDEAHQPSHVYQVIENSFEIAKSYETDDNIVYTVAVFHDLGLIQGRAGHEAASKQLVLNDPFLQQFFDKKTLELISHAVEDHRASKQEEPRNLYGKIISEADLDLNYGRVLLRCIQYSLRNASFNNDAELFGEVHKHLEEKYGSGSRLKLWLDYSVNALNLAEIRQKLTDVTAVEEDFKILLEKIRK